MKHQPHTPPSARQDQAFLQHRRSRAAGFFRKGLKDADIARRLDVSRAAVHYWRITWKKNGRKGLAPGRPGRKSRLTPAKVRCIRRALLKGPRAAGYETEFWTLGRIAKLIRNTAKVSYHPGHVWYLLKDMGWSCQKPETRARERDEKAIRRWKEVEWPRIQKRG